MSNIYKEAVVVSELVRLSTLNGNSNVNISKEIGLLMKALAPINKVYNNENLYIEISSEVQHQGYESLITIADNLNLEVVPKIDNGKTIKFIVKQKKVEITKCTKASPQVNYQNIFEDSRVIKNLIKLTALLNNTEDINIEYDLQLFMEYFFKLNLVYNDLLENVYVEMNLWEKALNLFENTLRELNLETDDTLSCYDTGKWVIRKKLVNNVSIAS